MQYFNKNYPTIITINRFGKWAATILRKTLIGIGGIALLVVAGLYIAGALVAEPLRWYLLGLASALLLLCGGVLVLSYARFILNRLFDDQRRQLSNTNSRVSDINKQVSETNKRVSDINKIEKGEDKYGRFYIENAVTFYDKYGHKLLKEAVKELNKTMADNSLAGTSFAKPGYFEFGVWNGRAAHSFANFVNRRFPSMAWHYYLFDSFQGLPDTRDPRDVASGNLLPGTFKSTGYHYVHHRLLEAGIQEESLNLIEGWFEDTLTSELRDTIAEKKIDPVFVCIDCDYYTSTMCALEWLRPILKTGTLIYFHDIWCYYGSLNKGELRAIHDFNKKEDDEGLVVRRTLDPTEKLYSFWRDSDFEIQR